MGNLSVDDLQFFDPNDEHTLAWKRLPHLAQAGTLCFITWRTDDSLPVDALERIRRRRNDFLKQYQIAPDDDWSKSLANMHPKERALLYWSIFKSWDEELDNAQGACVLREAALSRIVMNSLLYFDNDRYVLTDAVIMPNHVHLIAAFRDEGALLSQCTSWKHYTATQINRWLWKAGNRTQAVPSVCNSFDFRPKTTFWQNEQFDHMIRSPEDFAKYRKYIAQNPEKAKLREGNFCYYQRAI